MKTLIFLLSTIIELYTIALLLRIWIQLVKCDFYDPFSQFILKITQPILRPLYNFFPKTGLVDHASTLLAFVLSVIKAIIFFMVVTFQPIIWIAAALILIKSIGSLVFWTLLVMVLMSCISQNHTPSKYMIIQLTEPLLSPIRKFLSPIGGIDFSPIILVVCLYLINIGIVKLLQLMNSVLLGLWMTL